MRYNIQKLQRGGGIATFTPIIEQASPQDAALVSSFGETPKKSSILDDASFKQLLKGEGLTNDIIAFTNELSKLESSSTNPFVSGSNRGYGLKAIAKIYELKNNKEAWQDAIKTSRENGGYSEVAVGNQGELYTKDSSGKIGTIDATEYAKNRNKVKVLSVAELLNERQNNSQLTGQNQVFDVANNSVGMGKITDHIKGLISAFGTESQDETKTYSKDQLAEQYKQLSGKKPTAEDMTSMKTLANILSTPGDYYKVTQENSSERNHVDKALDYI